jgi:hypothetical protein
MNQIGKAKMIQEGSDLTLITWGACVFQCLEALDRQKQMCAALTRDQRMDLVDDAICFVLELNDPGDIQPVGGAEVCGAFEGDLRDLLQERGIAIVARRPEERRHHPLYGFLH